MQTVEEFLGGAQFRHLTPNDANPAQSLNPILIAGHLPPPLPLQAFTLRSNPTVANLPDVETLYRRKPGQLTSG